jgi:predicted homoserine dehydrogenase-like protein
VSVAQAALRGVATGTPRGHVADVVGVASAPIDPGTTLSVTYSHQDEGAGDDVVDADAVLDAALVGAADAGERVPFGLLDGAEVVRRIDPGDPVTREDVALETDSFAYHLRRLQDATVDPA